MRLACILTISFSVVLTVFWAGCGRNPSNGTQASFTPLPENPDTIFRMQWLGRRKLGVNGSAYYFMRLWDLQDSQELQKNTLEKLARLPWRYYGHPSPGAAPEAFFRPVLEDLIRAESFLEFRQAVGKPGEFALAARLNDEHAGSWFTNLAATVQTATGLGPLSSVEDPHSWRVNSPRSPRFLELKRVGEWTVVGLSDDTNSLLAEITDRIRNEGAPAPPLKDWLALEIDLPRFARALGAAEPALQELPQASITINGDGARVLTSARLRFPQTINMASEPWKVPSGLIHEPLTSFTAVRGIRSWLASLGVWNQFQLGDPPDQLFFWARKGGYFQTYLAIPAADSTHRVRIFSDRLMTNGNPWLEEKGYVAFERAPDGNGVAWGDQPGFRPFLRAMNDGQQENILAGLVPEVVNSTNSPISSNLLKPLQTISNLVYYDWEATPARIEPWLFISQNARVISRHSQLPMNSAGASLLASILPRVDASETYVTQTGPNELSLSRKSSTGFTAPELHLLVDWLESPDFPSGLYSLTVTPLTQPKTAGQR